MKGMTFYVDKLEEIYELQKSFTERFFKEKQNLTLEEVRSDKNRLVKWNKEYILALIAEATEVLNEVDWKMHKQMNLPNDARERLLEESIDVMKFLLGLMIVNGFSLDDIYSMFKTKSKVVEKRLK
jgi:phosphoribosyl-ATP pyrophosphohydrolase